MCGKCIRTGSVDTYKERLKNAIIAEKYDLRERLKVNSITPLEVANIIEGARLSSKLEELERILRIIDTTT